MNAGGMGGTAGAGSAGVAMDGSANGGTADGASGGGGAPDGGSRDGAVVQSVCRTDLPGPKLVEVPTQSGGHYCMDATEVTNAQYATFLAAKNAGTDTSGQRAACSSNATYVPSDLWPATGLDNHPVAFVDWCDADAYCKWANKRLCGAIGGGPEPFVGGTESEWFNACSAGGTKDFPYGPTYDGTACNGPNYGASAPIAVGSATGCEGAYAGLFDLSGNVAEWEDSCNGETGGSDECRVRGGFYGTYDLLMCGSLSHGQRMASDAVTGFRCCDDATDASDSGAMGGTGGAGGASGGGGASGTDGGGVNGCPKGLPGPALVEVPVSSGGAYCVDATEVTNADYAAFLAANGGGTSPAGQDAWCDWNTTYVPTPSACPSGMNCDWPAVGKDSYPVVSVDWCDAYAYCRWAQKHLCGKIGGGPNAVADHANATKSEWYNACSAGGTRAYPYGAAYDGAACNDANYLLTTYTTLPVGSASACEGGVAGLFDMSGNVFEWEDSCPAQTGATDYCLLRGGAMDSIPGFNGDLACSNDSNAAGQRSITSIDVGFRCCASL